MRIAVVGCGRWGTYLAWYLHTHAGHGVILYGRNTSARFAQLQQTRRNDYLTLPDGLRLESNLDRALADAQTVILSIGAQGLRAFMQQTTPAMWAHKTLVLCMKGLEAQSGCRLTQVVQPFLPDTAQLAIWVGPGHVQDFLGGIPNCMVIDAADPATTDALIDAFSSELIRFYYGRDLLGNEIGAASKNVIGIAAGMLDGMHLTSLKGALMSRGTREIARLIGAMGGQPQTAYGLSHLGDYEATVFSPHSHNRAFGERFAQGQAYDALAEGAATSRAMVRLAQKYGVELPICTAVYRCLYERAQPRAMLSELFLRSQKAE